MYYVQGEKDKGESFREKIKIITLKNIKIKIKRLEDELIVKRENF